MTKAPAAVPQGQAPGFILPERVGEMERKGHRI